MCPRGTVAHRACRQVLVPTVPGPDTGAGYSTSGRFNTICAEARTLSAMERTPLFATSRRTGLVHRNIRPEERESTIGADVTESGLIAHGSADRVPSGGTRARRRSQNRESGARAFRHGSRKAREAPPPVLVRGLEFHRTRTGLPYPVSTAVALRVPLRPILATPGPEWVLCFLRHDEFGRRPDHLATQIGDGTLFQNRLQGHHVRGGHRGLIPIKCTSNRFPKRYNGISMRTWREKVA